MRSARIAFVLFVVAAGSALGEGASGAPAHPLEPPDTSSPRATLGTFLAGINRAWELFPAGDPAYRDHFLAAIRCLDTSEVPPHLLEANSVDAALVLKEVLDRLELPPLRQVPGGEEVAGGLTRWTVPHTEIEIVLIEEGPRQGEFLFSAETVERSREFFDRVRSLPYRPGKTGAHYDELRFGAESRTAAALIAKLPSWAKREYGGQQGWQWLLLALLSLLSLLLAVTGIALGRRLYRSENRVTSVLGGLLGPITLMSLQWVIPPLAPWRTELGGTGVRLIAVALLIAAYLGAAWLVVIAIRGMAGLVIRFTEADERPLHRQLILVVSRIVSVLGVTFVLFRGGQSLGVPVSALLTGLGVGGLAVALAAQSTLENLIGGINLFADRPVRIGDFCKFGDELGVVEAIGLRSTRIRTQGRTVVSIPNSTFARMQLENLSQRDRNLLRTRLRLGYDTGPGEVESLLEALRALFSDDERVADEPFRIRLLELGKDALEIEIFLYVLTNEWDEYLAIREELLLGAMRVVEAAGLRLALPTERHEVVPGEES